MKLAVLQEVKFLILKKNLLQVQLDKESSLILATLRNYSILSSFFSQTNQHKFRHQIWYYHNASNYRTFQLCAFKSTSPKYFQPATLSKVKLWLLLVMMIFWILLQLFPFIKMKNKRISKIVAHLKCLYILKYF